MERTLPPFRADQVGSLLRPQALREARAAHAAGTLSSIALTAIEDQQIELAIERQEAIGLRAVTDGEYRRAMWHFDFLERLEGVESYAAEQGIQFKGVQTKAKGLKVTGKIRFAGHPMIDHFRFVRDHATDGTRLLAIDEVVSTNVARGTLKLTGTVKVLPGDRIRVYAAATTAWDTTSNGASSRINVQWTGVR